MAVKMSKLAATPNLWVDITIPEEHTTSTFIPEDKGRMLWDPRFS
jgi:hypothetical protein